MNHDQNFKNLILDYSRKALEFFAEAEAASIDPGARIIPIRQEQLKERLGDRFRELDIPLLVEWPDGRREALLFVIEEESQPGRFSIHRLAHYCLDLSELFETDHVCDLGNLPFERYKDSDNIAARPRRGGTRRQGEFHPRIRRWLVRHGALPGQWS